MVLEDSTEVMRGIHVNRWRVGEDRGSKEKDRCPLTIPDTSAVKPKASQSTDGNLLWSEVYISDTACLCTGAADDTPCTRITAAALIQGVHADTRSHQGYHRCPLTGRTCGGMLDLYVGYDKRLIAETSLDYTTFQTPFGAL
jgi:hypothetical protein